MEVNEINSVPGRPFNIEPAAAQNSTPKAETAGKPEKNEKKQAEDSVITQTQGEIRSVSDDGDELRVSSAAAAMEKDQLLQAQMTGLNGSASDNVISSGQDGTVTRITEGNANDDAEMITDFTGYTMTQIEQLYYQGRVSRYDYEQELEKDEELKEELGIEPQSSEKVTSSAASADDKAADTGSTKDAASKTGNDDTAVTGSSWDDRDSDKSDSAEKTSETIEQDKEAADELGKVFADKEKDRIQSEALETAAQYGRSDIISSVFGLNG